MGKEVAWGRTSQRAGEKTHVGVPLGRTHISCPMSSVMKRTYSGKKTMLFPLLEKCINHRPRKRKPFSQHGNRRRTECVSRWRQPKRHRDMVNNKFKVNWNLDRNGPPGAKSSSNRGRPSPVARRPSPVARRLSASPRRRPSLRAFLPSLRTAPRGGGRVRRRRCRQLTRRDGLPHHIVHHL